MSYVIAPYLDIVICVSDSINGWCSDDAIFSLQKFAKFSGQLGLLTGVSKTVVASGEAEGRAFRQAVNSVGQQVAFRRSNCAVSGRSTVNYVYSSPSAPSG